MPANEPRVSAEDLIALKAIYSKQPKAKGMKCA